MANISSTDKSKDILAKYGLYEYTDEDRERKAAQQAQEQQRRDALKQQSQKTAAPASASTSAATPWYKKPAEKLWQAAQGMTQSVRKASEDKKHADWEQALQQTARDKVSSRMAESTGSNGQQNYSSDKSRLILAKYGLADYTEDEQYEIELWNDRNAAYLEDAQSAADRLGTLDWESYSQDANVRDTLDRQLADLRSEMQRVGTDGLTYWQMRQYYNNLKKVRDAYDAREQAAGYATSREEYDAAQQMENVYQQLGTEGWDDWQNDAQYQTQLALQLTAAQRALDQAAPGSERARLLKERVDALQGMQDMYTSRADYYGQFADRADWEAYQTAGELFDAGNGQQAAGDLESAQAALKASQEEEARVQLQIDELQRNPYLAFGSARRLEDLYTQLQTAQAKTKTLQTQVDQAQRVAGYVQNRADWEQATPWRQEVAKRQEAAKAAGGSNRDVSLQAKAELEAAQAKYDAAKTAAEAARSQNMADLQGYQQFIPDGTTPEDYERQLSESVYWYGDGTGEVILPDGRHLSGKEDYIREEIDAEVQKYRKMVQTGRELEEAYKEYSQAQTIYNYAKASEYSDLQVSEDYQKLVEAGKAAFDPVQQRVEEERAQRVQEANVGNVETAGFNEAGSDFYTYRTPDDSFTEEEKNTWYALYGRDPEEAYEYAIGIHQRNRTQSREQQEKKLADWGGKNAGTRTAAFVGSVLTFPTAAWDFMGDVVEYGNTGLIMPRTELTPTDWTDAMSSGAAKSLNEKYGTIHADGNLQFLDGKGLGDVYQLGQSIAQSMTVAGLGGGLTNGLFFFSAAKQGTREALDRGADPGQALLYGSFTGAAEVLGETLSVEHLINLPESVPLWLNLLSQAFTEGSEEGFTTILNTLSDRAVLGDASEFNRQIEENLANGMDYDSAVRSAWKSWTSDLTADVVGGALSGGISGGIHSGISGVQSSQYQAREADRTRVYQLMQSAQSESELDRVLEQISKDKALRTAFGGIFGQDAAAALGTAESTKSTKEKIGANVGETLQKAFQASNLDISQEDLEILREGYSSSQKMNAYVIAMRDGYRLGRVGMDYEKAAASSDYAEKVMPLQFRHAWELGMKAAGKTIKKDSWTAQEGTGAQKTASVTVRGQEGEKLILSLQRGENGSLQALVQGPDGESRTVSLEDLDFEGSELGELIESIKNHPDAPQIYAAYQSGMPLSGLVDDWDTAKAFGRSTRSTSLASIQGNSLLRGVNGDFVKAAFEAGRKLRSGTRGQSQTRAAEAGTQEQKNARSADRSAKVENESAQKQTESAQKESKSARKEKSEGELRKPMLEEARTKDEKKVKKLISEASTRAELRQTLEQIRGNRKLLQAYEGLSFITIDEALEQLGETAASTEPAAKAEAAKSGAEHSENRQEPAASQQKRAEPTPEEKGRAHRQVHAAGYDAAGKAHSAAVRTAERIFSEFMQSSQGAESEARWEDVLAYVDKTLEELAGCVKPVISAGQIQRYEGDSSKEASRAAAFARKEQVLAEEIHSQLEQQFGTELQEAARKDGAAAESTEQAQEEEAPTVTASREIGDDTSPRGGGESTAERSDTAEAEREAADRAERGGVSYDGATVGKLTLPAVNRNRLSPQQKAQIQVIETLGKKLGIRFVLYDSQRGGQKVGRSIANGMYQDGTIYLDVNAGKSRSLSNVALVRTAAHELTHYMQQFEEEGYRELKETLLDYLGEWKGKDLGQLVAEKMARDSTGTLTAEKALDEVVADGCEMMLRRTKVMERLANEKPGLFRQVQQWLSQWLDSVREAFQGVNAVHDEARAVEQMEAQRLQDFVELWDRTLLKAAEKAAKSPAQTGGEVKYSVKEGMSEEERYEELKDRKVVARLDTASAKYKGAIDQLTLIPKAKGLAEKILIPLAEDLGILNRSMKTPEVDIEFLFSKNGGLAESTYRQLQFGGDYAEFAKALINIDSILENAVLIERHGDKYKGTRRENRYLENVSVLLGAFRDGESIIPVQFEIKKTTDAGGRLYMTVALTRIKADVLGRTSGTESTTSSLLSASEYNIADIFGNIKTEDARFLKYVPNQFLNDDQKDAKQKAIAADKQKIENLKFQERDNLPEDRELLMGVRAMGRNAEELAAYQKKVKSLEALQRKLRRQQDALESAKKGEVVDQEGKPLDPKEQKKLNQTAAQGVLKQIEKTEASIRRAEKALADMERTPQIRQEAEKALAAWREQNPNDAARAIREMRQERDSLMKLLRDEARLTTPDTRRLLPSDVRRMAQNLIKEQGSSAAVDSISEKLQALGDFLVSNMQGGDTSYYVEMMNRARQIAREIVDESYETIDENREIREGIRSYLKNHSLRISDDVRADIPDFERWRKAHMGTLRMGKEGMDIDQAYQDLRSEFGEGFFPADITARSDQLQQILDALDQVEPISHKLYSEYEGWQAAEGIANEIVDRLLSGEVREKESMADKALRRAEERVKAIRQESIERDRLYRGRIAIDKKVVALSKIMLENSGKRHVPDAWKETIGNFLASIDTLTARSGEKSRSFHLQRIEALQKMVARQQKANEGKENGEGEGPQVFLDINPYIAEMLQPFVELAQDSSRGTIQVNQLSVEQMRDLEEVLTGIREAVDKADQMLAATEKGETLSKTAGETIEYLESLGKAKSTRYKWVNNVEKFMSWDNLTPVYFFKRFGPGGEKVFRELQRGWGQLAFNAQQIIDFSEKTYTSKEVREWEQETHEFRLVKRESDLSGRKSLTKAAAEGGPEAARKAEEQNKETVTVSTAQLMGLYCLVRREQARGHVLGGGIRIWDIEGKHGTTEQAERYLVTAEDIAEMTDALTDRQKEVADELQKFMNTVGSSWGNQVSQARYGVDLFTEDNYYPIITDPHSRNASHPDADGTDLFHILNMGFTKNPVKNARNGVVLHSIFDVFSNHMADMAKYNAMGLPMLDAMKWLNYLDETGDSFTSTRKAMESAYGKQAERYFLGLIQDLNGSHEGGRRGEDIASRMISHSKVASVGANLRVAALQPTSYIRALAVLGPKYMMIGENPARIKQGMREALQYSGTAVWKDLGFYDMNINANMRTLIKHADGTLEKIREVSMKGAEWGDKYTWAKLWNATKAEVKDKTGLSGEELLRATAERFDAVIYETQVMDSTMTRSHMMRQKGAFASMVTSFMSEPTLSYNLLLDAVSQWQRAKRGGTSKAEAGKKAARAFAVYGISQVLASIVESAFSAMRDDDDYESFAEKWIQAEFGWDGNLMQDLWLHNKLPVVRDVVSILEGFSNKRMDTEWVEDFVRAYKAVKRDFEAGEIRWGTAYSVLRAMSTMTGLPMGNAARDSVALWNTFVVQTAPDWKLKNIKTGTIKPEASIRNAYKAGTLTEEEAVRYLMRDAEVETEEKARQKVFDWGLEEGQNRYDAMLDAISKGDSGKAAAARQELLDNGFSAEGINTAMRERIKQWYQGTNEDKRPRISKEKAIDMLVEQGGMRRREAEQTVLQWTSYVASPEHLQYDEIQEAYVLGEISAARAEEMRVLYGGKSKSEAKAEVLKWQCERDSGIKYTELEEAYLDGQITREQAVKMRMQYGGQNKSEAEETLQEWTYTKDTGDDYSKLRQSYVDGEISQEQAIQARMYYGGKTKTEAEQEIRKWRCEVETGMRYEEIEEAFVLGEISQETAVELRVKYGGQTKLDAGKTVQQWLYTKDTGADYDKLRVSFVEGSLTEQEAISAQVQYGGKTRVEAEADVLQWQCEKDTGIRYDNLTAMYVGGEIDAERAVSLRAKYGGKSLAEAQGEVLKWQCEKDTGVKYDNIRSSYLGKELGRDQAKNMLVKYGGLSEEKAEARLQQTDFIGRDPNLKDATEAAATKYYGGLEQAGISKQMWWEAYDAMNDMVSDKDSKGKTITDSLLKKKAAYIDSLPLTNAQKDLIFLTQYKGASLKKTPWH